MKRLIIFLSMALLLSFEVNAQTLATDTFNDANGNMPAIGSNFNVPINVTSIGDVATLTVYLQYDSDVLNYTGSANAAYTTNVTNPSDGIIKVEVSNFPNPTTVADGKLIDIQFDFIGGTTSLVFGTFDSPAGGNKSNILHTDYTTSYFYDADVTNGAVEGGYTDNSISGGDWNTATNWTLGVVPNSWHNVTVYSGTETTLSANAEAHNLTIAPGGQLTLNGYTLTVGVDMTLQSDASGDGSFIGEGTNVTVGGTTLVERYVTNGMWHGFSSPVDGATFASTYHFNGTNVWVKEYDEASDAFTYIDDTNQVMGSMTGYYTWLQTSGSPQTFEYEGSLRSGTMGSTNNMSNSNTGFNFVGNPFTSALDWDAVSGWTKTNLDDAIYVYNGTSYASYIAGTGTNGGSQYIAMGQGFFVHVAAAGTGTLQVDNQAAVHNTTAFMKSENAQIVRLQLADGTASDETVIRFSDQATDEFDGSLDAYKMFSYDVEYPQIYSVSNDFMSINSLPFDASKSIAVDVKGKDGDEMTIAAVEDGDLAFLNLKDNFTGVTTDLKSGDYTFTYNSSVANRFELYFGFLGVDEAPATNYANIYAYGHNVNVKLAESTNADITIYNLLGQTVDFRSTSSTFTSIAVEKTGYYIVKVNDGLHVTTQKVFIK